MGTNPIAAAAKPAAAKPAAAGFKFEDFESSNPTNEWENLASKIEASGVAKSYTAKISRAWATSTANGITVSIELDTVIPTNSPVRNDRGELTKSVDGHTLSTIIAGKRILTSNYAVATALRHGNAAGYALATSINPQKYVGDLLQGATVRLLAEFVPKGTNYKNPLSTSDRGFVAPCDRMVHHVLSINVGEDVLAVDKAARIASLTAARNAASVLAPASGGAAAAPVAPIATGDKPF